MEIGEKDSYRKIRIRRVHLEEDTGKLVHRKVYNEDLSLVDFNRSGVPLVEIVTEPDFRSTNDAKEFSKKLQKIIRYLEVSDADMEKGSMRLEANVSISPENIITDNNLPSYKVELKNINSFRFMGQAAEYEICRQKEIMQKGEKVAQETRGWDEAKKATRLQRSKEDAKEYRYFPEPDIPPMRFTEETICNIKESMPLLPDHYTSIFNNFDISQETIDIITETSYLAEKIVEALKLVENKKLFLNWFMHKRSELEKKEISELVKHFNVESVKEILDVVFIENCIREVVAKNPEVVKEYLAGKDKVLMYLIGQVQSKSKGKADISVVISLLKKIISK